MRILRIAPRLYPDAVGGAAYHAHALSRDQAASGHAVTVATVRADPAAPADERRAGYRVRRFDAPIAPLGNEVSPGLARYLAGVDDVDVVHAHSHLYASTNLAALNRRLGSTALAITNHGLYSQTAPPRLVRWYLNTLGRWTLNRADLVLCYSAVDGRALRDLGVETDVAVVPNGIDVERFAPDGPASDIPGPATSTVLFVGRLVEGKRPGLALEALDRLREREPDARLVICGDGPLREALEARADDGVSFLGEVDHDEMPGVYRRADALVLPSRTEGMPRTMLEALASGLPVVASDLPQIAALEADGAIVTADDAAAFADGLARVLNGGGDGTAGRRLVEANHRWQDTVERTTAALAGLID